MSVRRELAKLRGRSRAELAERGAQWLAAAAERMGLRGGRELQASQLERAIDRSQLGGEATLTAWFARHRAGTVAPFFAGLADRGATIAALRDLVPDVEREVVDRAHRMLAGEFDLLGFRRLRYPLPIDWHRDPVSGIRAPLVHWSRIRYLDPAVAGDHKALWEINRHQILISLGQAYWYTGDERWAAQAMAWLEEWMDANPPGRGVNWASSLEIAFRSIAWVWTLQLLRQSPHLTAERFARATGFLALSARHIQGFLSTYFSPNTHLTGEALGLYVLGTQLAPLAEAKRWRTRGLAVLLDQLPRHAGADGVYFEQATWYQRYTIDFYLHLLILAERCGDRVDSDVSPGLRKLLDSFLAIERADGTVPLLGDDDGGRLHCLDLRGGQDVRAPMATAAVLFDEADYAFGAQGPAAEMVWLLGPEVTARWRALAPRPPHVASRAYVASGLFVLRDGFTPRASLMVIDCGPHGVFNCGHAHADALAFDLTVDGIPALVDPGTYTYTASPAWRDYFRSTRAHNTVSVNGESSSQMHGPFAWRSTATSTLDRWHASESIDYFQGTHTGFERPPLHAEVQRSVLYAKAGYWVVRDIVTAPIEIEPTATLQVAAGLSLGQDTDGTFVARSETGDVLRIDVLTPDAVPAIESGWVSTAYGVKSATPRLGIRLSRRSPAVLDVVLSAPRLRASVVTRHTDRGTIIEVWHGEWTDRSVFRDGAGDGLVDGVDTDADVFFLRRVAVTGKPCEVFASGATRLSVDGVVVGTSPVPSAFAARRDAGTGEWRRQAVGATATAREAKATSGGSDARTEGQGSDKVTTPSVEVPYYSG